MIVNPRRIFKCDKTALFFNPKLKKFLAAKGSKNVFATVGKGEKLNLVMQLKDIRHQLESIGKSKIRYFFKASIIN